MRFERISLKYGNGRAIFEDFSLEAAKGQVTCLLGTSGIGKTTLLKLAAGLIEPTAGTVARDRRDGLATFFRSRACFRGKRFGKTSAGCWRDRRRKPASVCLPCLRQRVSVVRAFAARPGLLLLDEPFQSLDAATRADMHRLFRKLWEAEKPTVLLVTHDLEEALALGTRIVVLGGRPANLLADVAATSVDQQGRARFSEAHRLRLVQMTAAKEDRMDGERYG